MQEYDKDAKGNRNESVRTRCNRLVILSKLVEHIHKPFSEMTGDDLKDFIYSLEVTPVSKDAYKAVIKKFFKWHLKTDDTPIICKWMKTSSKKKRKLPEDLLTLNEVKALISATDNARDAALVALFYDSGARLGEVLGLDQKDVKADNYGFYIMVDGKTGQRRVRLTVSAPYIKTLFNSHPEKGPINPLFLSRNGDRLSESHTKTILHTLSKRANLGKHVHPHLFRHSRMTHLASHLKESELKVFAGWTGGSRMPEIYVHLSGCDVDNKILEISGLKDKEERKREKDTLKPRECLRCSEINAVTNLYCSRCGLPLTAEAESNSQQTINAILAKLKENPEILMEAIKNLS